MSENYVFRNCLWTLLRFQAVSGNVDAFALKSYVLRAPQVARFVRLNVVSYHRRVELRWELYGCDKGIQTEIMCIVDL